jgi:phage gp36-like protein
MTYATQTDMTERYGAVELAQLTDRSAGLVIDTTVLARALADADAEIDGYLATRYTLPLASTPAVLVRLAADIARHSLYGNGVTEAVRNRYQDAVSLLKRISSGDVQLAGESQVPVSGGSGNAVAARTPERVFSATQLADY